MKLREMLKSGEERLREAGISNAAYEARLMMQEAYGKEAAELLAELDRDVCPGALGAAEPAHITRCPGDCGGRITFDASISQRVRHVPLQQILGYTFFMGLRMNVNRHVLIPRQDTETLAETVLEHEKETDNRLLDLCTGSGCLAAALGKLGGYRHITASDVSRDALHVAMRNAALHGVQMDFVQSDLFEKLEGSFDVIVSNPPYIATDVIETLEPEVRDHDQRQALDGGPDGLDFYRRIASEGYLHMVPGGRIYLEIGYDQAAAVQEILTGAGFSEIRIIQDLAGQDRVVCGVRE